MHRFLPAALLLLPFAVHAAEVPASLVEAPAVEEADASVTRTYRIDPKASALWVTVFNDTSAMASRFAHDHAVAAMDYDATVVWNTDDASACQVSFEVPVAKLWPDPPGFRERAKIDPEDTVNDSSKSKIVANMLGKSQLDSSSFPSITFRSTSCTGTTGSVQVTGDLTIRGVSKRLSVPMHVTVSDGAFAARGHFELKHGDFGFEPFSNLGGALRYLPPLKFGIDVKGSPVE